MTTHHLPVYIPSQVCDLVGLDPATPPDVCMDLIHDDVAADGVSAPDVPANKGLPQVVADAKAMGIDLKVVVLAESPGIDTPLRDVATAVGHAFPGSTVLVLSPSYAGTYSPTYDRATLEAGQDVAKVSGNPVAASQNFVTELTTPHFPWTPFTIVVVLGVAVAAVGTRMLQVRARKSDATKDAAPPVH